MELILSVACETARTRPDGKLDFVGVFNELNAPGFPAMETMTVVFVLEWARNEAGRKRFRADLVHTSGGRLRLMDGHTDVDARSADQPPAQTRLILPPRGPIPFPHPGRYHFELDVEGEIHRGLSLHLIERPDAS